VIKQWGQFPDWGEREHRVLTALVPLRLPIPKPLYYERSSAEEAWLAMEFLPGEPMRVALAGEADATRRSELLTNWGAALRQLHASAPPAELRTEMDWVDRALARAAHNLAHFQNDNMTPELLRWLQENRPAPGRHGLIHCDCTVDNTLVLNGQVTGFIDWSDGTWGDVRYDLALATRPKPGIFCEDRERDLAAFYTGYGRPPITPEEWQWCEEHTRSSEPAMPQRGITPWE
jgi:aminoglycoside phosphotransferase (APT) family kinase protein